MPALTALVLALVLGPQAPRAGAARLPAISEEQAVARARAAISREKGIDETALALDAVAASRWPDASLGCPEKGMVYPQVVTPGWRVALRSGGQLFEARVSDDHTAVCGPKQPKLPPIEELKIGMRLQQKAKQDLADALKVSPDSVQVRFFKPMTWPDTTLGCAASGAAAELSPVRGFLIELEHEGKPYPYHSDYERVVACPKP